MQETMATALRAPWAKWITGYYLATPLFVLLDLGFGANLRALALESLPGWKLAYYGLCLTCGVVAWRGLRLALPLALLESTVNLLLLMLSILLPHYALLNAVLDGGPAPAPLDLERLANFAIPGSIWTAAFYARLSDLQR